MKYGDVACSRGRYIRTLGFLLTQEKERRECDLIFQSKEKISALRRGVKAAHS
jgi:hypothetical protein